MSAWSDWKCGAISDEEYACECRREAAMDRYLEEKEDAEAFRDDDNEEEEEEDV